ncbi:MAG: peptide chain release factor N(5)-glutamine methyltransferase [Actinobacteria bacterium]|nr:MAG: peptide chain release factor N(5)-glutamine methyltransferase [Actinomycetota bacterium]
MKLAQILTKASDYLSEKKFDNARMEAEILLSHVLNLKRVELYANYDRPLNSQEITEYREILKERLKGKPLQYITGECGFRYLKLRVKEGVFIPRPETEGLVELVLDYLADKKRARVFEIGVGTGAIALSLVKENKDVEVTGVDVNPKAIALTKENAIFNKVEQRLTLHISDLFGLIDKKTCFNVIVANPPYISLKDQDKLEKQVVDFEPKEALFAEDNGMAVIEKIIRQAPGFLVKKGLLALEIAESQADKVTQIAKDSGFLKPESKKDLNGRSRYLLARC